MGERRDILRKIEDKHFGRCFDQVWAAGRRHLIELVEIIGTNRNAVLVKQFESRVPMSSSGKPWPDLAGVFVYVPIERDDDNTWDGLDRQLAEYREANVSK